MKLVVCAAQKPSLAETMTFALEQETARFISKIQVHKVRGLEVVNKLDIV